MNIIVAFPKREISKKLNTILMKNGYDVTTICTTGAQTLNAAMHSDCGVIVCGIRFADMMYHEVKENLPDEFEMIVASKRDFWQDYGEDDVVYLPMPFKMYDFLDTLDDVVRGLNLRLKKEKNKPKERSEEEKSIIIEAKKYLMDQEGYTEEGAHRLIQKESMDSGCNMVETARFLLERMNRGKENK